MRPQCSLAISSECGQIGQHIFSRSGPMAKFHVTLKANLSRGELYWVCDIEANNKDAAMAIAEEEFFKELDDPSDWGFSDANVE
jgi:hypothetical protein